MTTALPQRDSIGKVWPPAPPAEFGGGAYRGDEPPRVPAEDMGTLADRIRRLMDLTAGRQLALPLGGRYFDAVVTANGPAAYGAVRLMDETQRGPNDAADACGPVIEDQQRGWLIWLVPPGTSDQWARAPHRFATCLGTPHQLALPPLGQTEPPGPYWLRRCRSDRLVPPGPLRQYLDQFRPGPVPSETVLGSLLSTIS
ncbi:hypothetical protein KBP30_00950 [Streptomyces sp. Go40/10]|uniref:hypothetical protein n=1 Tax=Streptomyces sp. Go40/10 TaxID=2825844 RepID=UPI001E50F635|nr:hypothetical protein [Streptomyces sp. Go40/10]UFQ99877.1 hypothetical protein KBP30_00950 [Streptomyces sp. Go40/10]